MIEKLESNIGKVFPLLDQESSAPATLYSFSDRIGTIGFIPSVTEPFCNQCDRIRLTSDGRFLTCLFENPGVISRVTCAEEHQMRSLVNA